MRGYRRAQAEGDAAADAAVPLPPPQGFPATAWSQSHRARPGPSLQPDRPEREALAQGQWVRTAITTNFRKSERSDAERSHGEAIFDDGVRGRRGAPRGR